MRRMVTIAGTEETVLKPVVNTIAKDLLHILKLAPEFQKELSFLSKLFHLY